MKGEALSSSYKERSPPMEFLKGMLWDFLTHSTGFWETCVYFTNFPRRQRWTPIPVKILGPNQRRLLLFDPSVKSVIAIYIEYLITEIQGLGFLCPWDGCMINISWWFFKETNLFSSPWVHWFLSRTNWQRRKKTDTNWNKINVTGL